MTPDQEREVRHYLKSRFRGYHDEMLADDRLDGVVDSLGLFELVEFLEQKFGLKIPNEEFRPERFATIARIGQTIEEFSAG